MSEGLLRSTISYNEVNTEQSCFKNSTQKIDDISEQRYISQNNSCVREALSATVKILLDERCFISSQPRPYQQDTSSNNLKVCGGEFRVFKELLNNNTYHEDKI